MRFLIPRSLRPLPTAVAAAVLLTLTGCSALYDAGFRSNEARYRALANPDVTGLSPEAAEERLAIAEDQARRLEFIERQRKLRQLGGGGHSGGGG